MTTSKKAPFAINEELLGQLQDERDGAQTVARAQADMIISLFGSVVSARPPRDLIDMIDAVRRTVKLFELGQEAAGHGSKPPPQLLTAVSRFLSCASKWNEAIMQREYAGLLELLMENHLDLAQQPVRKRGKRQGR